MSKFILILSILTISLFAEVKHTYPTKEFLASGVKVIDIRTKPEWKETGVVKDSIPITFFDERGGYDINKFLKELNKNVKFGEKFALICRTGSRTRTVSSYLGSIGYDVINLVGGVMYLKGSGYPLTKYKE